MFQATFYKLIFLSYIVTGLAVPLTSNPSCLTKGECSGTSIETLPAYSAALCQSLCKLNNNCNSFTFNPDTNICNLFSVCDEVEVGNCISCISGNIHCQSKEDPPAYVAFVVGGVSSMDVELFSPLGTCQHLLEPLPGGMTEILSPIVELINDSPIVCGGSQGNRYCWLYNLTTSVWVELTRSQFPHDYQPGAVYKGKLYIVDDVNPEYYDTALQTWNSWPTPAEPTGSDSCLLTWKDTLLLIGGNRNPYKVQSFNFNAQSWSIVNTAAPFYMADKACIVLPNEDVMVVGYNFKTSAEYEAIAIYNVGKNSWTTLTTSVFRQGDSLVKLGSRVFIIGGLSGETEEYHWQNNTLTQLDATLKKPRSGHSSIGVPTTKINPSLGTCLGIE